MTAMLKDTITIQRKDLQMLAEALKKANEIISGLRVRGRTAPKLSATKRGDIKWKRIVENSGRVKKADMLKK